MTIDESTAWNHTPRSALLTDPPRTPQDDGAATGGAVGEAGRIGSWSSSEGSGWPPYRLPPSPSAPEPPKRRRPWSRRAAALAMVAVVLLVGAAVLVTHRSPNPVATVSATQLNQLRSAAAHAVAPSTSSARADAASVARLVTPGLVNIDTTLGYQGAQAAGTGMVLTSTGLVLTNNHVIEGATDIRATDLGDGRTYSARVLGYDRTHDVALLQLADASGLSTVQLADSTQVKLGQTVVAIGNAGGTGTPSYAAGSIRALDQSITAQDSAVGSAEQLTGLIETDANIQAGESGGPLVDASGHVVGMDTAASTGFQFTNAGAQGYAVPISQAVTLATQIAVGRASSTVHVGATAFLGVEVASTGGSYGPLGGGSGATIAGVVPGGPAADAGLSRGDTITGVGGHAIGSPTALTTQLLAERPGSHVSVRYVDPTGAAHTTTVHLATGPAQ